jgi:hypothetical protein
MLWTQMPPLPAKVNGHNSRTEKALTSKNELCLHVKVTDLLHTGKLNCLRETLAIE